MCALPKAENKNINTGLLDDILEDINEGVILYHRQEGIIWCNQAACRLTCRDRDSLYGRPIREIFPDLNELQESCQLISDSGCEREKNLEVTIKASPQKGIKKMLLRDLSQQVKVKRKLQEYVQKYKNYEDILNSLDYGIEVVDQNGVLTFYNDVQAKTDHMKAENVLGKHVTEVYQLHEENSFLMRVLKTGKAIDERQDYITSSGRLVNVITNAAPLWRDGAVVGAVAITKDFDNLWEIFKKDLDPGIGKSVVEKLSAMPVKRILNNVTKYSFQDVVGQNFHLSEAISLARKAADSLSPVLIYGETGTGKEIFAQSIHQASQRRGKPFIAINCAAIPENLLEGILFGTVPGAFTGAVNRPGLFEQASQGTIFLDEINSMPLSLQAKLLRVIQEGTARRVGGVQDYRIDIRLISSSNQHPMEAIHHNTLRSDLFYRIGVINISLPPLRERKDDLPLLLDYFIRMKNEMLGKKVLSNAPEVTAVFLQYDWPGNVRQLEHVIECAMNAIGDESQISWEHLPEYIRKELVQRDSGRSVAVHAAAGSLADELVSVEIRRIIAVLEETDGNISQAAARLQLSRQCLQYRMKKYQISIDRSVNQASVD